MTRIELPSIRASAGYVFAVCSAGYFEAFDRSTCVGDQAAGDVVKPDPKRTSFRAGFAEHRTGVFELFAVRDHTRGQGETQAYILFVGGVNVCGIADVDDGRHPGIRERQRLPLGLPWQFGPGRDSLCNWLAAHRGKENHLRPRPAASR